MQERVRTIETDIQDKKCGICKHRETSIICDYGETNSLGHTITVYSCYAEYYVEKWDDCVCTNFEWNKKRTSRLYAKLLCVKSI